MFGGKQILRKGLSPLITTISTDSGAPVIAGARLRAGKQLCGRDASPARVAVKTGAIVTPSRSRSAWCGT